MVRAPCCEKMGLKKGPWSPEEDHILINYIRHHGHGNWRALPKLAGLLRCGKSCRLRWTNYLRPDIKRGNFTREEEETIIQLHEQLGNRWSAIAAKLPGRTDNEIKNVWHTHLKKRVPKQQHAAAAAAETFIFDNYFIDEEPKKNSSADNEESSSSESPRNHHPFLSPQPSSSDESSSITNAGRNNSLDTNNLHVNQVDSPDGFPKMDEEFWSEVLSADTSTAAAEAPAPAVAGDGVELEFSLSDQSLSMELPPVCDEMEFWYDLFAKAGELPEFSEF